MTNATGATVRDSAIPGVTAHRDGSSVEATPSPDRNSLRHARAPARSGSDGRMVLDLKAIESYSQMIGLIGDKDSTTRRMIEDILAVEQSHAEELRDWPAD